MDTNSELILIRITGVDRPGLTASITETLSHYDVTILDIGQADIHSTLSLGILFKSKEFVSVKQTYYPSKTTCFSGVSSF